MTETRDGTDASRPGLSPPLHPTLRAYLEELARHRAKVAAAAALTDEEKDRLNSFIYALKEAGLPLPVDLSEAEGFESAIRTAAKFLLASSRVPQARVAELLGVSQSSISHALSDRSYGLTTTEVWAIEALTEARRGMVYELARYVVPRSVEESLADVPGMTPEAFEPIVAAIHAVESRASREKELEQKKEESFDRFWGGDRAPRHTP